MLDIHQPGLGNSEFSLISDLAADTKYHWRVRAFNTAGQYSDWSDTRSFHTPIQLPTLTTPEDGTTGVSMRPELGRKEVSGASRYTVEISSDSDFNKILESGSTKDLLFTRTADLPANTTLYWRAQAEGSNGPGLWSETYSFTTKGQ